MGGVKRDAGGAIIGYVAVPNDYFSEHIADDHPDVVAFNTPPPMTPPTSTLALFNHENRLRSQEGTPPLTLEDFRQQFKV